MIRDKILGAIRQAVCGNLVGELREAWEEIGSLRDQREELERDFKRVQALAIRRGEQVADLSVRIDRQAQTIAELGVERDGLVDQQEVLKRDLTNAREQSARRGEQCSAAEEARESMRAQMLTDRKDAQRTIEGLRRQLRVWESFNNEARKLLEIDPSSSLLSKIADLKRRLDFMLDPGFKRPDAENPLPPLQGGPSSPRPQTGQLDRGRSSPQPRGDLERPQCRCAICRFGVHEK